MAFRFGSRSRKELDTCHPDLIKIAELAIKRTPIDFGIHQGGRTVEQQRKYFREGKSSINPDAYSSVESLAQRAKHVTIPGNDKYGVSRAFDFHIASKYEAKSLTWDDLHMGIVIGVIWSCADELYDYGEISHRIRSGGDWDRDGVFVYDHKLKDLPHIEIIGY